MTLKDKLLEFSEDENVHFLKFLQKYKFTDDAFHFFFEGFEDQSFYINYINLIITNPSEKYICLGKKKVYSIYNLIDWSRFHKCRVLFFVDKDYSSLLNEIWPNDINIFVTKYYSVENYSVNEIILERIIREIFHFNDSNEIKEILSKFNEAHIHFYHNFHLILSWILYVRSEKIKAHLNEIDLALYFNVKDDLSLETRKMRNRSLYLQKVTSAILPIKSWKKIKFWKKVIESHPEPKDILRGKFELWFLISFTKKVETFLISKGHKPKTKTQLTYTNSLEILAPRIIPPKELLDFIKINWESFCDN